MFLVCQSGLPVSILQSIIEHLVITGIVWTTKITVIN